MKALRERISRLTVGAQLGNIFSDINESAWYYNDVLAVYEKNIMTDSNGRDFSDVGEEHWAYGEIMAAID